MMPNKEDTANDSENIKIFVRILPLLQRCDNYMKISPDKKTIFVKCQQSLKHEKTPLYWSFRTNRIFYDCSQKEIYTETMDDAITKVLDGANCAVISCGQTGTGKSFTLGGLRNNWEHRGFVPRLLADLLAAKVRKKHTNKIHYSLSYVEFRGRNFRDLLNPHSQNVNGNKSESFKNITRVSVKGERDALRHIFQGEGRRALAEGSMYPACHLGTAVITFHVHNTSLITSWAVITEAAIHVVEMAGIDTPGRNYCPKKSRDVVAANSMKLEVEHFFTNLGGSGITASPIARSSGLIKYLGDALRRDSLIRFIAHVRLTREDISVTLSALRLAAKIGQVQPQKISYNVKPQEMMIVEKLNKEIAHLKRELDVHEMFFGQEALMNVSKSRAKQIEQHFLEYLNGTISDVELLSFSQMQILAKMIKDFYAKITAERQEAQRNLEKCEAALKNAGKSSSKTSIEKSVKVLNIYCQLNNKNKGRNNNSIIRQETSRKKSISNDRVTSVEVTEEIETNKVGTLDLKNAGITLGSGITKTPASSALRILNVAKISRAQSRENREENPTKEESKEKEWQRNMRENFEVMQKMLARLIEVRPETRKPWDTSTNFTREK